MKNLFLFLFLSFIFSCNSFNEQNIEGFKNAIIENDKTKVREFIDFPILSNDIWFLINEKHKYSYNIKPFTKNDFDENYNKLFPDEFIKLISKIDFQKLESQNGINTQFLKLNNKNIKMISVKDNESISLHFLQDGNDKKEFDRTYVFEIFKNNDVKLLNIFVNNKK